MRVRLLRVLRVRRGVGRVARRRGRVAGERPPGVPRVRHRAAVRVERVHPHRLLQPVPPVAHGVVGAPRQPRGDLPPPQPQLVHAAVDRDVLLRRPRRAVRRVAAGVGQRPRHLVRALLAAARRDVPQAPRLRRVRRRDRTGVGGPGTLGAAYPRHHRMCRGIRGVRARLGPALPSGHVEEQRGAAERLVAPWEGVRPSLHGCQLHAAPAPRGDPLPEMKFAEDIFSQNFKL